MMTEKNLSAQLLALSKTAPSFLRVWSLFIPFQQQGRVWIALALSAELSSILDKVSEPIVGQIRLAWWREQFDSLAQGKQQGNTQPLLAALQQFSATQNLPWAAYLALVDEAEVCLLNQTPLYKSAAWPLLLITAFAWPEAQVDLLQVLTKAKGANPSRKTAPYAWLLLQALKHEQNEQPPFLLVLRLLLRQLWPL